MTFKPRFRITYDVVTEESSRHGDTAHRGFLPRTKAVPVYRDNMPKNPALFTLRDAMDLMGGLHCEADSCPVTVPRWITVNKPEREDGTRSYYEQGPGASISLSLHLDHVSPSSAYRIARLFGVYGLQPL